MRLGIAGILLTSALSCSCTGDSGTASGTGGAPGGTGGRSASGGSAATGGTPGSGGASSGGAVGSGGAPGTGGAPASGGGPGTGGAATGTGGSAATAGASGAGPGGRGGAGGRGGDTTGSGGRGGVTGASGGAGSGGRGGAAGGGGTASATGGAGGSSGNSLHWVGTWTAAPQLTEMANLPPASLTGSVLRQVIRVSAGGSQIRLRFSNEFGNGPLTVNAAHVAVCKNNPVDSTIDVATDKALAFSGMAGITIAQGKSEWSDAVDFDLAALSNVAVTTAFGAVPSDLTGHPGSRTTSYQQTASTNVTAASMASAQKPEHWYVLSGVDVMSDATTQGIVVLGDSITDGKGSTTNANNRWPDLLAKRLRANAATSSVAVMNQGIGGNAVTTGGLGPTAVTRYMRDVLGQSGVRWVIVYEGVNDVGTDVAAAPVTAAFDQMISQAHAQGLLIFGATITPFAGHSYYSVAREVARQDVNMYIRSGKFDGVMDFDKAVRDSSTPPKLQAAYDSGDGLHMTPTGYQKLADTVDLTLFGR